MSRLALVLVLAFLSVVRPEDEAPRVKTPLGGVKGYYRTSLKGRKYEAFNGIPYALPPIGKLRFKVDFHHFNHNYSLQLS